MALNLTTQRIVRSVYKKVVGILVEEGYWIDEEIKNYPNTNEGETQFQSDLAQIKQNKGFAIEPFSQGSSQSKGQRSTPRIVILLKRTLEGNIGNPPNPSPMADLVDPEVRNWVIPSPTSMMVHLNIHLISSTSEQTYILEAIIQKAFGARKFIPYYDAENGENFFIKQYNYFDVIDPVEGEEEKVYCYEVNDVYLSYGEIVQPNIAKIEEITVEIGLNDKKSEGDTIVERKLD